MKSTTKKIKTTLAGVAALFAVLLHHLYLLKNHQLTLLKKVIHFQKSLKLITQLLRNWQKTITLTTSI